jgi:YVTN family beta-propeller protein
MRRTNLLRMVCQIAGLLLVVACAALPSSAQTETFYGPFAYVTNQFSNTVTVIDTPTHTVVTTISLCADCAPGPKGLAVTPNGKFVYVANSSAGTVSVIDTSTNTVSQTIILPLVVECDCSPSPIAVAITPDGTRAYVTDTGQGAVHVIDTNPASLTYNTVTTSITADVHCGSRLEIVLVIGEIFRHRDQFASDVIPLFEHGLRR